MKKLTGEHKRCSRCRLVKHVSDFYRHKSGALGVGAYCKPCSVASVRAYQRQNPERHAKYNREWDRNNPDRKSDTQLKTRLGLPAGTYAAMFAAQSGKCAICASPSPGRTRRFHVDHCKHTGAVRGLLCSTCNTGIGQMQHDERRLEAAIAYLRRYSAVGSAER